jgi:hypothetical protein
MTAAANNVVFQPGDFAGIDGFRRAYAVAYAQSLSDGVPIQLAAALTAEQQEVVKRLQADARRGERSIRREVRLVAHCTLKRHFTGCMREIVGMGEKQAARDPDRFVWNRKWSQAKKGRDGENGGYKRTQKLRCQQQLEGLGIFTPARRWRNGAWRVGWDVADHTRISEVVDEKICHLNVGGFAISPRHRGEGLEEFLAKGIKTASPEGIKKAPSEGITEGIIKKPEGIIEGITEGITSFSEGTANAMMSKEIEGGGGQDCGPIPVSPVIPVRESPVNRAGGGTPEDERSPAKSSLSSPNLNPSPTPSAVDELCTQLYQIGKPRSQSQPVFSGRYRTEIGRMLTVYSVDEICEGYSQMVLSFDDFQMRNAPKYFAEGGADIIRSMRALKQKRAALEAQLQRQQDVEQARRDAESRVRQVEESVLIEEEAQGSDELAERRALREEVNKPGSFPPFGTMSRLHELDEAAMLRPEIQEAVRARIAPDDLVLYEKKMEGRRESERQRQEQAAKAKPVETLEQRKAREVARVKLNARWAAQDQINIDRMEQGLPPLPLPPQEGL